MVEKRKDSKGRVLKNGESQRPDGQYMYRYSDMNGDRKVIYSWRLVDSDKNPNGKRSAESLRSMEAKIFRDMNDGIYAGGGDTTINEAFDRFIELRTDLKPTTLTGYIMLYDKHVRPGFGRRALNRVRYSDIYSFYMGLNQNSNLKTSSIQSINSVISQIFTIAVQDDVIRKNPADGVMKDILKRIKDKDEQRHALTIDQQSAFIDYVSNSKYKKYSALFTVLFGAGLRIGEALGLTIKDVSFQTNTINVSHSLSYKCQAEKGYEYHVSSPKSKAGIRKIPMFNSVRDALKDAIKNAECVQRGKDAVVIDGYKNFIFVNSTGKPYTPTFIFDVIQNIVTDYNREESSKAELEGREPVFIPKISAHIFRHTFCTRLCENEPNIKIVQDVMGHKNSRTTMDVYNEATAQAKQLSFESLEGKIKLA